MHVLYPLTVGFGTLTGTPRQLNLVNSGGNAVGIRFERTAPTQHDWELAIDSGEFSLARCTTDTGVFTSILRFTIDAASIGYLSAHYRPGTDNTYALGDASYRWTSLYASNVLQAGTGTLLLDTVGAGTVTLGSAANTVNLGGGANATTINLGNTSSAATVNIATSTGNDTVSVLTGSGTNSFVLGPASGSTTGITLNPNSSGVIIKGVGASGSQALLELRDSNSTARLYARADGYVGIGLTSGFTARLQVTGFGTTFQYGFLVTNSAGTGRFYVRDDGYAIVNSDGGAADSILAANSITNPGFDTDLAGWSAGADWSWSAGTAVHTPGAASTLEQGTCIVGQKYYVNFTVSRTAGSIVLYCGGVAVYSLASTVTTNQAFGLVATATTGFQAVPSSDFAGYVDAVIVRQQTGENPPGLSFSTTLGGSGAQMRYYGTTSQYLGLYAGRYNAASYCVGLGRGALQNSVYAPYATALGCEAAAESNGYGVVAIGYVAGTNAGSYTTTVGYGAGRNIDIMSVAVGYSACPRVTLPGSMYSVWVGGYSGYSALTAHGNTAVGYTAGYSLTTGTYNVLLGCGAGDSLGTSSYNTFVGYGAGDSATGSTNTCIGNRAEVYSLAGNHQLSLCNALYGTGLDGTDATVSTGNLGVFVVAPLARLHLPAGQAAANKAPLKFTSGTALTTPEDGAVEYHSSALWFTVGATRYALGLLGATSGNALTKTDDTNVTLTLGGGHATALLNAASLTLGWTGQLSVARGGTNNNTYNSRQLLWYNSDTGKIESSGQYCTSSSYVGNFAAETWYRVAASNVGVGRCFGRFVLTWADGGVGHGSVELAVGSFYNSPSGVGLTQLGMSQMHAPKINAARLVYRDNVYSGEQCFLEVKLSNNFPNCTLVTRFYSLDGYSTSTSWVLASAQTDGSIPTNYTALVLPLVSGSLLASNSLGVANSGYLGELKPATLGANRTWTFPNETGEVVLTTNTQTISGAKTFSAVGTALAVTNTLSAGYLVVAGATSADSALKTTAGRLQLGPQDNGTGLWLDRTSTARYWFMGLDGADGTSIRWYQSGNKLILANTGDLTATGYVSGTRYISTVAVGTAPLTVTSTTLVSNLNSDLLDGLHTATANTVSTVVARDASGNFSAGTITAALSGNASTATTLATARNINGTAFNGSANITTAEWGTSRTLTIGATGKAVNGSTNVSWSLDELQAEFAQPIGVPRGNLGNPTVFEAGTIEAQWTNKLAFYALTNVWVETSTNGTDWVDAGITDTDKRKLVGGNYGDSTFTIPNGTAYFRLRVRSSSYVYLNAFYLYWGAQGHSCTLHVYKKHDNDANWTQVTSSAVAVSGWPGHVYLRHATIAFNPSGTQGTHVHEVAVVFTPTWNPTYPTYGIVLSKAQWWGGYPAGRREPGAIDEFQRYIFPAEIWTASGSATAPSYSFAGDSNTGLYRYGADQLGIAANGAAVGYFSAAGLTLVAGNFVGNASTATVLATARTLTIGSTGRNFDGSAGLTWSLGDIGAAATSHTHGNLTNAGAIGSTANLPLITTTSGVVTTGSFGNGANTFCQGNDSRLSDPRTPTAHVLDSASHTISGKTAGQVLLATSPTAYAFTSLSGDVTLAGTGVATVTADIPRKAGNDTISGAWVFTSKLTTPAGTSSSAPGLHIGADASGYLRVGSSGWADDGTYFVMLGTRNFYIQSTVPTTFIYSPNIYLGGTSGTTVRLRGNALTHDAFGLTTAGRLAAGHTTPTAWLHLAAGAAAASSAPLKFTTGTLQTTPEAGAVEWTGRNPSVVDSATHRRELLFAEDICGTDTIEYTVLDRFDRPNTAESALSIGTPPLTDGAESRNSGAWTQLKSGGVAFSGSGDPKTHLLNGAWTLEPNSGSTAAYMAYLSRELASPPNVIGAEFEFQSYGGTGAWGIMTIGITSKEQGSWINDLIHVRVSEYGLYVELGFVDGVMRLLGACYGTLSRNKRYKVEIVIQGCRLWVKVADLVVTCEDPEIGKNWGRYVFWECYYGNGLAANNANRVAFHSVWAGNRQYAAPEFGAGHGAPIQVHTPGVRFETGDGTQRIMLDSDPSNNLPEISTGDFSIYWSGMCPNYVYEAQRDAAAMERVGLCICGATSNADNYGQGVTLEFKAHANFSTLPEPEIWFTLWNGAEYRRRVWKRRYGHQLWNRPVSLLITRVGANVRGYLDGELMTPEADVVSTTPPAWSAAVTYSRYWGIGQSGTSSNLGFVGNIYQFGVANTFIPASDVAALRRGIIPEALKWAPTNSVLTSGTLQKGKMYRLVSVGTANYWYTGCAAGDTIRVYNNGKAVHVDSQVGINLNTYTINSSNTMVQVGFMFFCVGAPGLDNLVDIGSGGRSTTPTGTITATVPYGNATHLGSYVSSAYPRKAEDTTITGRWAFNVLQAPTALPSTPANGHCYWDGTYLNFYTGSVWKKVALA